MQYDSSGERRGEFGIYYAVTLKLNYLFYAVKCAFQTAHKMMQASHLMCVIETKIKYHKL